MRVSMSSSVSIVPLTMKKYLKPNAKQDFTLFLASRTQLYADLHHTKIARGVSVFQASITSARRGAIRDVGHLPAPNA